MNDELKDGEVVFPIQEVQTNEIVFHVDNGATEVLRFDGNGDIFVKGRLVTNDMEIVEGLREFLRQSGTLKS